MRPLMIAVVIFFFSSCFYVRPAQQNNNLYGTWQAVIYPDYTIAITQSTMTFLKNGKPEAKMNTPKNIVGDSIPFPDDFIRAGKHTYVAAHPRTDKLDFNTMIPNTDEDIRKIIPMDKFTITFIRQ